ncbi:unnamed protein product [Pylaiella littoralis]
MAEISVEEREDGFGLLFGDARSSDGDTRDEASPALEEEQYTRPQRLPLEAGAGARSTAVPPTLTLSLVSSRHSLWGHRLWNAALLLAEMIDEEEIIVEGKSVLELGAGAGLPSLICALRGAKKVVISDYATSTDEALMVPIQINIDRVQPEFVSEDTLHAVGHVWGHGVEDLLVPLGTTAVREDPRADNGGGEDDVGGEESPVPRNGVAPGGGEASLGGGGGGGGEKKLLASKRALEAGGGGAAQGGFDVVIMADLLFNRSQHAQLLETCDRCLRRKGSGSDADAGTVWVSFSHHDPEKAELDMKFFALATEKGFVATRIKTVQMRDLFVENDGMDGLRGEVHLWCLKRQG